MITWNWSTKLHGQTDITIWSHSTKLYEVVWTLRNYYMGHLQVNNDPPPYNVHPKFWSLENIFQDIQSSNNIC
jgi:hypothetical protein